MARKDLAPGTLADLAWEQDEARESLNAVYLFVLEKATGAVNWYIQAMHWKKQLATCLRLGAIVLTSVGGILPILSQLIVQDDGKPLIAPAWASVILAGAAALIVLDQFFGFSSGWIRYVSTELRVQKLLDEFRIDWQAQMVTWPTAGPNDEQVQTALGKARTFVTQVNTHVLEETDAWVAEFQSALKQIDEAAKAEAEIPQPGGLNIVVTNGRDCADGWSLSVDGGGAIKHAGTTAALQNLLGGIHSVRVSGAVNNQDLQAEKVVSVSDGSIGNVEITLA